MSWRKTCRRWIRPVLLGMLAALCVYLDLRIDDAQNPSEPVPSQPVTLGVYVSDGDEAAVEALLPAQHAGGEPAWQVQVQAARSGRTAAEVEFSFGPLVPNMYGSTGIGYSTGTVSGSLPRPIHLTFEFPRGTTYISHTVAALSAGAATDTCAQWIAQGAVHTARPQVLHGGSGGWPDIVVCDIPAMSNAEALRIAIDATPSAVAGRDTVLIPWNRGAAHGEPALYCCYRPHPVALATLVNVAGLRWTMATHGPLLSAVTFCGEPKRALR
ncbi:MAG TPA: hypothetical protein VIQ76_14935 [Propionibacteriaceae bacterium]